MTPPARLLAAAKEVLWRLDMAEENDLRNGPVIPGAWVHRELRAAILAVEAEPKVERVEIPTSYVGDDRGSWFYHGRWNPRLEGQHLILEIPIAPPKPKEVKP